MKHAPTSHMALIEAGLAAGEGHMFQADKLWSRYSHDKVDIGERLSAVIRTLHKARPLGQPLCALSIGSSNEPQFRILETAFCGGLYLLDVEKAALDVVLERIRRQRTGHVRPLHGDYTRTLLSPPEARAFRTRRLDRRRMDLVTLHHSLYYCPAADWPALFEALWHEVLGPQSAVHAVLMACESRNPHTTTWLYNHFAGLYCGHRNNQCLRKFRRVLSRAPFFRNGQDHLRSSRVGFFVDDFAKLMAVVWMILLYPNVHRYTDAQREAITEHVYRHFWKPRQPLIQVQDHLALYRGLDIRGLV